MSQKRSIWKQIAPVSIDSDSFVLVYTRFGIPSEQNFTKMWFDKAEEELIRVNSIKGVVHWWKTNPWLDAEEVIES